MEKVKDREYKPDLIRLFIFPTFETSIIKLNGIYCMSMHTEHILPLSGVRFA